MARIEPKLRPSISITEMSLLSKVLDSEIRRRIQEGNKGLETLQIAKLKEYIDTFKPAEVAMPDLLAKYEQGIEAGKALDTNAPDYFASLQLNDSSVVDSVSVLNDSSLTDEQKYDLLLLEDSKNYSADETAFMNLTGFSIKMQRMTKTSVREDEL